MATAATIITAACLKIGVQNPSVAQLAQALISLNNMISSWGGDLLVPYVTRESKALTSGDAEYTIGSGGDWDTVRPIKIENAFLRDSDSIDWPLEVINVKEWNALYSKAIEGRPESIYFVPEYPLAKILLDYEPNGSYTLYCEFKKNFTEFAATTTNVDLPNEYKEALVYNLAVSLGEDWDRPLGKTVLVRAQETKLSLERIIAMNRPPAKASFDLMIGKSYNITTDQ